MLSEFAGPLQMEMKICYTKITKLVSGMIIDVKVIFLVSTHDDYTNA
jgi:hypothetical protein